MNLRKFDTKTAKKGPYEPRKMTSSSNVVILLLKY